MEHDTDLNMGDLKMGDLKGGDLKGGDLETGELNTEDVLAWLCAHPELFREHPELLEHFEFEHDAGTASLIERQVARLKDENLKLKSQLKQLIGIAGENQRLVQRLHRLTLELMSTEDIAPFITALAQRLESDFQAEQVVFLLDSDAADLGEVEQVQSLPAAPPEWLGEVMAAGNPVCGRLTRAKLEAIFGDRAGDVASAALVPLATGGVLAIGSSDPQRFFADMGTLFLELLGTTVDFRLRQSGDERRKRA